MERTKLKTVYEPDKFIKMGFFTSWKAMASNLWSSRELIWRLFLHDFNAKYRQSLLGVSWAILNPLITVAIFIFLRKSGIFRIEATALPYPLFALIGISLYGIFATGLSGCANSISGAGSMVVKINFPKISLVIASMGQSIVDFLVRFLVIIALLIIYGIMPKFSIIFLLFAIIPIILFTLAIGLMIALLAGVFRDILHLVPFLTTLFLFLVPALYPAPQSGGLAALNRWNPLSHLIIGSRRIIIGANPFNSDGFILAIILSLLIFLISWRVFFLSETKIAERV